MYHFITACEHPRPGREGDPASKHLTNWPEMPHSWLSDLQTPGESKEGEAENTGKQSN